MYFPSFTCGTWLALFAVVWSFIAHTHAAPATVAGSISAVSLSQIASYAPSSYYASAGYCDPSTTLLWKCGTNCQARTNFTPIASGGDGAIMQFWFVGYDSSLDTIVVSHQGTHPEAVIPLITDANFDLVKPAPSLFPGLSSSIEAHEGFLTAHSLSAADVLKAVQTGIDTYPTNNVMLTGHSLGAAISLIHTIYLPAHIPNVKITYVGYGLPRVGNQAFADYIDAHTAIASVTHINNQYDPVPIVPGRFLGFHHPSGEIHIDSAGAWHACPGQDNKNAKCTVGAVPNLFQSDLGNHDGPYNGIIMGCDA